MNENRNRGEEFVTEINYGLRLLQLRGGLCFGTDALLLAAFVGRADSAVELGCGSGVVSLLCAAKGRFRRITSVEVQPELAALAAKNVSLNGLDGAVEVVRADVRELKLSADAVFTNPPYMKADSGKRNENDGKFISRHEVMGSIADFCAAAARILHPGGRFYAVYRPDRLTDLLCAMRENRLEPKRLITVYRDVFHQPCLVLAEGVKDAGTSLFTPPPLIMYAGGEITPEFKYVYENGEFNDGFIRR